MPEPVPLIKGLLPVDSLAWLQGRPGHGKSFIALDMAGCVATGESWQGFKVEKPGPVLYLAAEGAWGLRARVRAWEASMGRTMTGVHFLPTVINSISTGEWNELRALVEELRPALIVLDTQARITVSLEENSAKDMGLFIGRLDQLRKDTGACVLVVHHQGRAGDHMRGSTALEGAATTILAASKDDDLVTVKCVKQKEGREFGDITLRMVATNDSVVLAITDARRPSTTSRPKWLAEWWRLHGDEAVSVGVLVKSGVVSETTFHRSKRDLLSAGLVVREGRGNATRYQLTRDPAPD